MSDAKLQLVTPSTAVAPKQKKSTDAQRSSQRKQYLKRKLKKDGGLSSAEREELDQFENRFHEIIEPVNEHAATVVNQGVNQGNAHTTAEVNRVVGAVQESTKRPTGELGNEAKRTKR